MNASAGLIDFHCHLDLYLDHWMAIEQAETAGVFTLAVTTTPRAWPRNHELTRATKHVRAALGLHPQLVAERASEISLWDEYFDRTRYIGEVGLDAGPRFYKSFELQKEIFAHVLRRCAKAGDKIITLHSVRAAKAVLDHVEQHLPPDRGKVVLHWFTGTKAEARRAVEMGCFFSINAAMFANERHAEMVASLPLGRLLTETDGPFTKTADRPSEPRDVEIAVEMLARSRGLTKSQMGAALRANLRTLLELTN